MGKSNKNTLSSENEMVKSEISVVCIGCDKSVKNLFMNFDLVIKFYLLSKQNMLIK